MEESETNTGKLDLLKEFMVAHNIGFDELWLCVQVLEAEDKLECYLRRNR